MALQVRFGTEEEILRNIDNIIPAEPVVATDTEKLFVGSGYGEYFRIASENDLPVPSDQSPLMDGTASAGESAEYSRADHKHPSDDTKENVADAQAETERVNAALETKVDKIAGKGLSQNDFTNELKGKLDGIEAGAQVNPLPYDSAPLMDDVASAGTSVQWARGDHVHPKDTSKPSTEEVEAMIEELREELYLTTFESTSVSGDIVHIEDGAGDVPIKALSIGIEAVQSGSGDPAPDNVRPITGFTGANVTVCGINLFDVTKYPISSGKYINKNNGGLASSATYDCIEGYFPVKAFRGMTLKWNCEDHGGVNPGIAFYTDKEVSSYISGERIFPVVVPQNANYMRFTLKHEQTDIMIYIGDDQSDYHAYIGRTYPVTWTEQGTIYGGVVDVVNGKLTKTFGVVDLSTLTLNATPTPTADGSTCYFGTVSGMATDTATSGMLSDTYHSAPTIYISNMTDGTMIRSGGKIYIASNTAEITGHLVYPLATPIEYDITPVTDIETLLGVNNIWADTGGIENLTYRISNLPQEQIQLLSLNRSTPQVQTLDRQDIGDIRLGELEREPLGRIVDDEEPIEEVEDEPAEITEEEPQDEEPVEEETEEPVDKKQDNNVE